MPIRIFRDILTWGAQRFLEPNTVTEKSVEKVNRSSGRNIDSKVFEGLRTDIHTSKITIENLRAAGSAIHDTEIAREIAILTRNHILGTPSIIREKQTDLPPQIPARHIT